MALTAAYKRVLERRFGGKIRFDEPMAMHTSFRIGGPADAMAFPGSATDIIDLVRLLSAENTPWYVLGGGTNLLVRDGGIRGMVISPVPGLSEVRVPGEPPGGAIARGETVIVRAQSGASLGRICRLAAERGYSGLAFAAGIPGTLGGAVMMNAGTPEGDISWVLGSLEVIDRKGEIHDVDRDRLNFEYRSLSLPPEIAGPVGNPGVVVSAALQLERSEPLSVEKEIQDRLVKRKQVQPGGFSAGSFFKNPPKGRTAGELIDRAGLKGMGAGGAIVSEKHANFIVNRNNATARDVLALMEIIQKRVHELFGVNLEPEVRIIGEEASA